MMNPKVYKNYSRTLEMLPTLYAQRKSCLLLMKSEFAVGALKHFTMTFVSRTGYMNTGPFKFIYFTDYLSNSLLSP